MEYGIKGSDLEKYHLESEDDLINHIESEHHIAVRREGETEEQCMTRFYKQYPEAKNRETCKCPECKELRKTKLLISQ